MKSIDDGTNFHIEIDDQDIILKYFRLIDEKNMPGLLSLFTEDCTVYEPLGKGLQSNEERGKRPLKGRNEIESFFYVVMVATDGLKHGIEFVCSSVENTESGVIQIFQGLRQLCLCWPHSMETKVDIG